MKTVELSAGSIEYDELGDGPPVVLLHGLFMDHTLWDQVLPHLPSGFRYIRPLLPLGSHRVPMRRDADLSLHGQVRLVADLLDALDLRGATLVHTDWGGALFLTALGLDQRVGRIVVLPSEAFDNFPPGLPGKMAAIASRLPGGIWLAARLLRLPWLRRSPLLFGQMAKKPLPDELARGWTESALSSRDVRRDLAAYGRTRFDKAQLVSQTEALSKFQGPALVIWASENKVMPMEHARRLVELMPQAQLHIIDDAYVLVTLDQPQRVAQLIGAFLENTHVRSR